MTTQEIWTVYNNDIRKFIISKIHDKNITEDIIQDTFIKIHTKLHTLKDTDKLKSWIFTVARNTIIDYFKSTKHVNSITNLELKDEETTDTSHTESDCLRGIIKKLPKKYRTPLFLADIKGMKQQEVANYLNQNLATTKSQIQRARKMITEGFMNCCDFILDENGKLVGEIKDKEDCKICK